MQVKNLQNQKGFTLVEIAIVLVIIGLLLGGVLKGQELITNSKIKSVTQDFDGISAAYYAYQDRTGLVPGDIDKNGLLDDTNADGQFWIDLRTEGFIKGVAGTSAANEAGPVHALDGSFSVGSSTMMAGNYICADQIEVSVAQGMDTKSDNGVATSGTWVAGNDDTGTTAFASAANATMTVCKEL